MCCPPSQLIQSRELHPEHLLGDHAAATLVLQPLYSVLMDA